MRNLMNATAIGLGLNALNQNFKCPKLLIRYGTMITMKGQVMAALNSEFFGQVLRNPIRVANM